MEKQSITLHIFGRKFPAKVSSEEVAIVEQAASEINEKMKFYRAEYASQDDIDIAIMCCLDIMTSYLGDKVQQDKEANAIKDELSVLEQKLDHTIHLPEKN